MKRGVFIGVAAVAFCAIAASAAYADEGAALAAPPLVVSLTPGSGGAPWKLHVENTGDVPVRVAADPRLLVLDVTPPAGFVDPTIKTKHGAAAKAAEPKPTRCILPEDARPASDEGKDLVIPAKRSWTTNVDPLFVCFGARERSRLVSGATVTAHFGWPAPLPKAGASSARATKNKTAVIAPPFVTAPVGAAVGKIAPAKELVSAPVTLTENVAGATSSATGTTGASSSSSSPPSSPAATSESSTLPQLPPGSASLVVTMPEALDVARGAEIATTVTVANEGDKAAVLLFRPDMLRFNVAGPAGSVACGATRAVDAPIRELFSTIAPKARASLSVLVTAVCPADTFDEPGVYRVTAVLDTSEASGRSIGLKTWDGTAEARTPMLLRVRTPRRAPTTTTRPALD